MIIEDNSESYKEFLKIVDEKVAEFKKSNKDNLALTMFAFNLDEFHEQFKKAALQDNLTNTEEQVEKLEMKYPLTMDEIFKAENSLKEDGIEAPSTLQNYWNCLKGIFAKNKTK